MVQDLAGRDVDQVRKESGFAIITRPSLPNLELGKDTCEPSLTIEGPNPMRVQRFREAITPAIDRNTFSKIVMNSLAMLNAQDVPEPHLGHVDDMGTK